MNKRRLGKILMIAGIVSIFAFCMVFVGLDVANIKLPQAATLGIGARMLVVSLPMICVGDWLFRERGRISANKRKFSKLPYREISDYKVELDGTRANFAADTSSDKNRIPKSPFKSVSAYFDFSVIGTGKIYYGCSGYPECKFMSWDIPTGKKCEKCGSALVKTARGTVKCSNKECDYKEPAPADKKE